MMYILRKGISRNLFIGISIVFFFLVALMTFSFHYMIGKNSAFLRSLVMRTGEEYALARASMIVERMAISRKDSAESLGAELRRYASADSSVLGVLIFARTADDRYFRVLYRNSLHASFRIDVESGSVVMPEHFNEYLQKGLFAPAVDPIIHTSGAFAWRNVYHPFRMERRNLVICFMVSSLGGLAVLDEYETSIEKLKRVIVIIHSLAAVAVVAFLAFFLHYYRLLLNALAHFMKRASRGDLSVSISAVEGDELEELATSFNNLVEELRVMKEREKSISPRDTLDDVFKAGVEKLKAGMLEDAMHIFSALTILRPESFGSYFNLGVAYAKMRRYTESIEMFDRALAANPHHAIAHSYRQKVHELQLRYGEERSGTQG